MGYRVEVTKRVEKQLAKLNKKDLLLVASAIDELERCENPCALPNAKKLQGVTNGWRWRVGVYRLLGVVDGGRLIIELFRSGIGAMSIAVSTDRADPYCDSPERSNLLNENSPTSAIKTVQVPQSWC